MIPASRKKPPIVRLPPKSSLEVVLQRSSQSAIILMGLVVAVVALHYGRFLLAPAALAIVIGLMLGPLAARIERGGLPPVLSALFVTLAFVLLVGTLAILIAVPLTSWSRRLPQVWSELQFQLSSLREPLDTVRNMRDQIRAATGESGVTVTVEEGSAVEEVASLAPALIAQVLIFLAGLYFFVATRHETRLSILRLCVNRRLRWRVAHIFRDVEEAISRYLLSIALINTGLGLAVGTALFLVGVPSAALWGALAGLLNFIMYIGPAVMAVILFGVGLATFDTLSASFMPPLVYLSLNLIEAQFVTPLVIGRRMTLNPFVVFLAITFWLWLWGPIGGFVAIPALLAAGTIIANLVPASDWQPAPPAAGRAARPHRNGRASVAVSSQPASSARPFRSNT